MPSFSLSVQACRLCTANNFRLQQLIVHANSCPLTASLKLCLYCLGTVLIGASVAPLAYWLGGAAAHLHGFEFLAQNEFSRFFDRSILFAAIFLLVPVIPWIGPFLALGFCGNRRFLPQLLAGFLLATFCIGTLAAGLLVTRLAWLKHPLPWAVLPNLLITAFAVSLIEETLFRGAFLGILRQSLSKSTSVLIVAVLFSTIHFIRPARDQIADVRWYSGFELLPTVFWQFSNPVLLVGGFTTILILGLMLGHAALQTRSLWLPIGLHAGIVFGKIAFNKFSKRSEDLSPWIGQDLTVGFGPILILLFLWGLTWLLILRDPRPTLDSEHNS